MALRLGDTTARDAGRLTLNPAKHLELFGSFLFPLMLYFLTNGSVVFGWARPVPYNPLMLKDPKRDAGLIALAGPGSNLVVAIIFGLCLRALPYIGIAGDAPLALFFSVIVFVNILLGIFNLLPLPPLDGSKVLFALLPDRFYSTRVFLERYGFVLLLAFIFFGFGLIQPLIFGLFRLFAGSGGVL